MSAKAFLQRYRAALSYRTNLERVMREEYREAIARAQGVHGQQGSQDAPLGVKVQSAPQGDAMAQAVAQAVDQQRRALERITQAKKDCEAVLCEILELIAQIPGIDQRALLTARYVHGDSFHRIQVQMGISERKVFRLHAAALAEAEKILKKTQKWQ